MPPDLPPAFPPDFPPPFLPVFSRRRTVAVEAITISTLAVAASIIIMATTALLFFKAIPFKDADTAARFFNLSGSNRSFEPPFDPFEVALFFFDVVRPFTPAAAFDFEPPFDPAPLFIVADTVRPFDSDSAQSFVALFFTAEDADTVVLSWYVP